jgi:hypothetical protein
MKKLFTLTIAVALATATITTSSYARIGETLDQAIKRYGSPQILQSADGGEWARFYKGEFGIDVRFYEGKIDTIEYVKLLREHDRPIQTIKLSEVEIGNFLKANYPGTWTREGYQTWIASNIATEEMLMIAEQGFELRENKQWCYYLIIHTREAAQRLIDKVAAEQTNSQSGF